MKNFLFLLAALLALLLFTANANAQTLTKAFGLAWTDNSTNEDGFKLYRKNADGTFTAIGQVGANQTTFTTPPVTAVEGSQVCYAVSAFNAAGESAKAQGCGNIPVTPVTPLPLVLESDPHTVNLYGAITINLTKPANATKSILVMDVYDVDYPNEGELYINGNGPIALWGTITGGANTVIKVEFDIPLSYWVNGDNKLRFSKTNTIGYKINSASVRFELPSAPNEPSAITVTAQ